MGRIHFEGMQFRSDIGADDPQSVGASAPVTASAAPPPADSASGPQSQVEAEVIDVLAHASPDPEPQAQRAVGSSDGPLVATPDQRA